MERRKKATGDEMKRKAGRCEHVAIAICRARTPHAAPWMDGSLARDAVAPTHVTFLRPGTLARGLLVISLSRALVRSVRRADAHPLIHRRRSRPPLGSASCGGRGSSGLSSCGTERHTVFFSVLFPWMQRRTSPIMEEEGWVLRHSGIAGGVVVVRERGRRRHMALPWNTPRP